MNLRRLRAGEWLAAAGGIALLVALALPWYGADSGDISGYEVFTVIDVLLVLVAAFGLVLAILQATRTSPALPVALGVLTVVAGTIGTLLTVFRLIDEPGVSGADAFIDVLGAAYLGLVASLAITAGGWLSIANERVRGLPPDREPKLRPAPEP